MLAFEQAASELNISWGQGQPAWVILGVQVQFRHDRPDLFPKFFRMAWIFELSNLSELKEYFAAARSICAALDGYFLNRSDSPIWRILNLSGPTDQKHASAEAAALALNHATVAFAALSAWGCGPHAASTPHASNLVWSPSELELLLEVFELNRAAESSSKRLAGPRL